MANDLRSVDNPALATAINEQTHAVAVTRNKVQAIASESVTLAGSWTGEAGSAFTAAIRSWEGLCEGLLKEMQTFINQTGQNKTQYANTESQASEESARVRSAMVL